MKIWFLWLALVGALLFGSLEAEGDSVAKILGCFSAGTVTFATGVLGSFFFKEMVDSGSTRLSDVRQSEKNSANIFKRFGRYVRPVGRICCGKAGRGLSMIFVLLGGLSFVNGVSGLIGTGD